MRLASILVDGAPRAAVVHPTKGVAVVADLLPEFTGDVMSLIADRRGDEVDEAVAEADPGLFRPADEVTYTAPYRNPPKIWGIGLNYVDHAADLAEVVPDEPASFIKGNHTIIGPGEPIPLPVQSERVTAEAEVGLVIGRYCRDVEEDAALGYVFGLCAILDQTAEDILQRNPRFLTRSKNFPGFFSFGPHIVPLAEALAAQPGGPDLADVQVSTVVNGERHRSNVVGRMRFSPAYLVSFHSKVMPLYPGDIISTGTPGAVVVEPGDVARCEVSGLEPLVNPVVAPE
ncbi:fumarylacetoacetate hydrolase family protein [Jiangella alkaliphila]|uniref:2-keto-4-pentenoate hydratase/2-oxohepta-3-ene-1,7-dioic acid hydratase (Catechol pathway) n=1 Tax=Jiangella alkaliphila TaxID=419479 RepID=A0A1H2HHW3_9ACTN|nr:fumarylacetoacetate hydrolase family protein [Jiangella alkaliphila]SDU31414.1 2-keto-4-pentenoate hydratase/2-oxohepta-3-ene-1,7-dioic acid hydratase (catechol pathway) [Jiangella alkaliphila]